MKFMKPIAVNDCEGDQLLVSPAVPDDETDFIAILTVIPAQNVEPRDVGISDEAAQRLIKWLQRQRKHRQND